MLISISISEFMKVLVLDSSTYSFNYVQSLVPVHDPRSSVMLSIIHNSDNLLLEQVYRYIRYIGKFALLIMLIFSCTNLYSKTPREENLKEECHPLQFDNILQ